MEGIFYNDMLLGDCTLDDVIPYAQKCISICTCKVDEKVWYVTNLLNKYLESYSDGIIVIDGGKLVGIIDGREWVRNFVKRPSREFFSLSAQDIMSSDPIIQIDPNVKLAYVIEEWKKLRRAIAVIEDHNKSICAPISLRTILETISASRTDVLLSSIKQKKSITINSDDKIIDALLKMLQNNVRRLVLEEDHAFVSDRIVIGSMVNEFCFLRYLDNFVEKKVSSLKAEQIKEIGEDIPISKLCKILMIQKYPCVLYNGSIITPWDLLERI